MGEIVAAAISGFIVGGFIGVWIDMKTIKMCIRHEGWVPLGNNLRVVGHLERKVHSETWERESQTQH